MDSIDLSSDWVTVEARFEKGKIFADVPQIEGFDPDSLVYNVDVALNGQ